MIVIERDGRVIVIRGWRAWLIGAITVVVTAIVLGALSFLVLGIAVSVAALLMILIPTIVIVALLGSFLQPAERVTRQADRTRRVRSE